MKCNILLFTTRLVTTEGGGQFQARIARKIRSISKNNMVFINSGNQ